MPTFDDPSGALANRFLIFPFTESFQGREDYGLEARLMKEIQGIMVWAINGLKRLQSNNMRFSDVQEVNDLIADTRRDMFPLADFVEECCIVGNGLTVSNADLYKAYKYWTKEHDNKYVMSDVKFGKTLKSSYLNVHGYRYPLNDVGKRVRGVKGIKLNDLMYRNINPSGGVNNVVNIPAAIINSPKSIIS
jgi:putative DNA primase/helicase